MPTYDSEYWRQQRQMATELGEPFAEPFPWAPASMTEAAASLPDDVREKLKALKCAEERVRAKSLNKLSKLSERVTSTVTQSAFRGGFATCKATTHGLAAFDELMKFLTSNSHPASNLALYIQRENTAKFALTTPLQMMSLFPTISKLITRSCNKK